MNSLIDSLNMWGGRFMDFAWPVLWQSSLLIAVVFALDFLLRRKVRAAVRYSFWFVVFLKLMLPPSLALPTGAAWWLRSRPAPSAVAHTRTITVNYSEPVAAYVPPARPLEAVASPAPKLSREGWMLLIASAVSGLLAVWVVFRWRQIARCVQRTNAASDKIGEILSQARRLAGLRRDVALRITAEAMSPAVCGLFKPVILLPQSLIEKLTAKQLRAVLLHELVHLRRRDVWVNCAQTLLQIVYWWHPLLWIANARVRRLREEAVDDAVMCALNAEAEVYAPTLLEVAKLAFSRPSASLGLVGILESRSALRHRIERLLNFTTPRRAGVSMVSLICLAAFTALAVPMGEPPARPSQAATDELGTKQLIPYRAIVDSEVFARNIRAWAGGSMHTASDDLNEILVSIMDGFEVDCTGERAIHFDKATGEVTAKNTSAALGVLDEVVKELNLKGGEHVLNPPHGLPEVLIEAQFYLAKSEELAKLKLTSKSLHSGGDLSPWAGLSPEQLAENRDRLKALGVNQITSPRIQTAHGITASLSTGDGTNNIQWECVPYVHDGVVNLTVLARTTGKYAPEGKNWPDIAGRTNCAIFARVKIASGDGVVLGAAPGGAGDSELIVLLKAKILEPGTGRSSLSGSTRLAMAGSAASTNLIEDSATQSKALVKQLLEDGKLLFKLGKSDEAELKFNAVLAIDPKNGAAEYYMSLIEQVRAQNMQPPSGARAMNVPGPGPQTNDARLTLPVPNLSARTNQIFTSAARKKIYEKLNSITFDKTSFPGLPLTEVMGELAVQTQRRDVDQEGINFIINKSRGSAGQTNLQGADDFDIGTAIINVDPGLKNARLLDVLEAITKNSDHPISYAILDYGIEFSAKGPDQVQLHTRTFKVDVNTFLMGLEGAGVFTNNLSGTNSPQEIQMAVIKFSNAVGVDLKAPKSVFYNPRQGTLTMRATDEDLALIERAISALNIAPPEVTVKARFVEINDDDMFKPGFEWFLEMMARKGTNVGLTGILTEPIFRTVLKTIAERKGADLLNEGQVTTLSGRQANFQVIEIETNSATASGDQVTNNTFGTSMDVAPQVLADGYTIKLTLIPTITDRVENPVSGNFVPTIRSGNGGVPLTGQLPSPHTRVRQVVVNCTVWDGQTAVLLLGPYVPHGKTVVVFVTTTIINPDGNRKNSDEDLLFAQKAVPPQTAR